jgi:formamidopyrimidine-DNA glycosylase
VPELPDVERYRRFLADHAVGRRIRKVRVTDADILRNTTPSALGRALLGRRLDDPDRHGKWLVAWTDGPALLLHFGMTGDLLWGAGPAGRHRHDRVILEMEGGELRYRNMRKLGGLWLAHGAGEVAALLEPLGPDALRVSRAEFHERLGPRRGRVKPALMDQRLVAGIGNLVADEALWLARIDPVRPIEDLSDTERDRLYDEVRAVLRAWIRTPGEPPGSLLAARGTPDPRCPRCGDALARSVVGGRTTYHCPVCQGARGGPQAS